MAGQPAGSVARPARRRRIATSPNQSPCAQARILRDPAKSCPGVPSRWDRVITPLDAASDPASTDPTSAPTKETVDGDLIQPDYSFILEANSVG